MSWDHDELQVAGDNRRTAKYRLLQSWYRDAVLETAPGTYSPPNRPTRPLGSLLDPDAVAARPGLNFLDDRAYDYAIERSSTVQSEHGTLDETRLMHNMLSSMPLCFNLFGLVRAIPEAQLPFVRSLFDPEAVSVELIECEWTPRLPASSINDRTAFDAAIITRRADGGSHLVAIETKYTESFSQKRYGAPDRHDADRYRDVHDNCGWFDPAEHDELTRSSTNQLWRNCLLAAATEMSGEVDSAEVAVVCVSDDPGALKAIDGVTAAMTEPGRCRLVSLERIVESSRSIRSLEDWAHEFERRYLDLTPVE